MSSIFFLNERSHLFLKRQRNVKGRQGLCEGKPYTAGEAKKNGKRTGNKQKKRKK